MKLLVIRHGITGYNKREMLNGLIDEPLAPEGRKQAEELVDRLADKSIDSIYTSPLRRAIETVAPLANHLSLEINQDKRIIEVNFGKLVGKTQAEIGKLLGATMVEMLSSYNYDFHEFDGESSDEVHARVESFINDLKKQDHKTALVVTHGGIIRMINYVVTGQKIGFQTNAKLIELDI